MDQNISFKSKDGTCAGVLTRPEGVSGPTPLVIMAGGWCYVKELVMPHYAKFFHQIGCATLRFDYRNFGDSSGERRQHLDPWEQIEDYRNALTFAETLEGIDASSLGVWGISYSGGHVLVTAAIDPRVKFAISTIPVIDGFQTMRRVHGEARFAELQRLTLADRRSRGKGEPGANMPMSSLTPFEELSAWPVPLCHKVFNEIKHREAPNHEHFNTIESVELLTHYNVVPFCSRIIETPVLMTTAAGDNITSADLETQAFNSVANPNKTFVAVEGVTHMSLYSDVNDLGKVGRVQGKWLKGILEAHNHS